MRLVEIVLLLLPLAIFLAWRLVAPAGPPPRYLVWSVIAAVASVGALLFVLRYEEAAPPTAGYVPARQDEGRIVPPRVDRTSPAPAPR